MTHRTVQRAAAVGIRQTVDREDILAWWQGALGELHATARVQGRSMREVAPIGETSWRTAHRGGAPRWDERDRNS